MSTKLYPEDQARVDKVTSTGVNQIERKPFRVWVLLGIIVLVLLVMSGFSLWLASLYDGV